MQRYVLTSLTSVLEELLTHPPPLVFVYDSFGGECNSQLEILAPFASCMTNKAVWFSLMCEDLAVAHSAAPSVVPTATPSSLSSGAKADIGVGVAVFGLLLIGLLVALVVRNNKKKRKRLALESAMVEADSKAELPSNENKGAARAELPPQTAMNVRPVEAPGDQHWPRPPELEGDTVVGSAVGDEIETHPRQGEQVNPGVVHLRQHLDS